MKRERKRDIKNYSNFRDSLSMEFNGLFIKKEKLRIDVKRLAKSDIFPSKIIEKINRIPRNTKYFFPKGKEGDDYRCNLFNKYIEETRHLWIADLSPLMNFIKKPNEFGDEVYRHNIFNGILEHDECETVRSKEIIKRSEGYSSVLKMIRAQFIHYIGSIVEVALLDVFTREGHVMNYSSRKEFKKILCDEYGIEIEELLNYSNYLNFYALWNFMKHSSKKSYDDLKSKNPEIMTDKQYKNGTYSLSYLKLNDDTVTQLLDDLDIFFSSFSENVFNEDLEEAKWNYDQYFLNGFSRWKNSIDNPLDIPRYL